MYHVQSIFLDYTHTHLHLFTFEPELFIDMHVSYFKHVHVIIFFAMEKLLFLVDMLRILYIM